MLWISKKANKKALSLFEVVYPKPWMLHENATRTLTMYEGEGAQRKFTLTNTYCGQVLTEVAFQVQEANPVLSSITVQYIPQVGYVICCEAPTTLPDFVFQFQEDDTTFYYKDACCRDLDESIGDIYGYVLDIQRELLEELTMALLENDLDYVVPRLLDFACVLRKEFQFYPSADYGEQHDKGSSSPSPPPRATR
ncbi:hypothetical protein V7S43_006416 [Phytophthora oleae]|uniref:Uncharacterized protein n=1 Tax=Phytophthora oleae TaxID=2107226 RepID=A0ABD3FPV3_9STRA